MTRQCARERVEWEVDERTADEFTQYVRSKWGAVVPYKNREVEDAVRAFLDVEAPGEESAETPETRPSSSGTASDQRAVRELRDADLTKTRLTASIHAGLKAEVVAFAQRHDWPDWVVVTIALRRYLDATKQAQTSEQHSTAATTTSVVPIDISNTSTSVTPADSEATDADSRRAAGSAISLDDVPSAHAVSAVPDDTTSSETRGDEASSVYGTVRDTPVKTGFDAVRERRVDEVIAQLADRQDSLPRPFSRGELYRAAASVGVPVWQPDTRDAFTERILDRIAYEWNEDAGRFGPEIVEPVLRVLRAAADAIESRLAGELPATLREKLAAWSHQHGFDSVETAPARRLIARQTAFNLLLKATLYEWYHRRGVVPALPDDIRSGLQTAAAETDRAAFTESVLDDVAWLHDPSQFDELLEARHRLLFASQPAETIGRLYEQLTADESRRTLGQYHTPRPIASLMRRWAVQSTDDTVLDPGVGAGSLSTPSHPRWVSLADPSRVTGVDTSQLSVLMGATAVTLADRAHTLEHDDFLDVTPSAVPDDVDAIVCNPPYTRHQRLSDEAKSRLVTQAERDTGRDIPATSPLYAYFMYHLRQFLDDGDRAAILTYGNSAT